MCYGWYEELSSAERMKLATRKADELKRNRETPVTASAPKKEQKPAREEQPEAVPV